MRCLVAFDDTDSGTGGCTTHLGYRVTSSLLSQGCVFRRYPRLVRLNPNIPFKTRGNAAVCIDFETEEPEFAFETAESLMRKLSDVDHGANSGAVFLEGDPDPRLFRPIYEAAIAGMVSSRRVARLLREARVRHSILGNGMGLVGATASVGFHDGEDHTYELIAYRRPEYLGTRRLVDPESVQRAERVAFPHCFNNYDYSTGRVLITPHGPDPVFFGIRADSPKAALAAFRFIRYEEPIEGYVVYLSNQCTDAHLVSPLSIPLLAYSSGWVEGTVCSTMLGEGGHLYISLSVEGHPVPSAVYEEAGDLSREARLLAPGDRVRLFGGVRRGTTRHSAILNVEKLQVIQARPEVESANPGCEACGGTTKSEGRGKGFQCRTCGAKTKSRSKVTRTLPRRIRPGIYLPSPGAQRHLTKQLIRYGRERRFPFRPEGGWIRADFRPLRAPAQSPL